MKPPPQVSSADKRQQKFQKTMVHTALLGKCRRSIRINVSAEDLRSPAYLFFLGCCYHQTPGIHLQSFSISLVLCASEGADCEINPGKASRHLHSTYTNTITTIQHGPKYCYSTHSFINRRFQKALFFGAVSPMNYGCAAVALRMRRSSSLHDLSLIHI